MAKKGRRRHKSIFDRERLRPAQLRTVADRRFGDARALKDTGENERANGAMYLAGFVIECMLKAALLEENAWLQTARDPAALRGEEKRLWQLCYRSHALDEILARLPTIEAQVRAHDQHRGRSLLLALKEICALWTILARYSPRGSTIAEAADFLSKVKEIKACLAHHDS